GQEVSRRDREFRILRKLLLPQHQEVVGRVVRQRPQQHGVDDREGRRVECNAERKGQDGADEIRGMRRKEANAVADVLREISHVTPARLLRYSARRACMGSTRIALRAGIYDAAAVTI